jgi:hypothetical protein
VKQVRAMPLASATRAYVSYRMGDRIYWTRKKLLIPEGELVLTDGVHFARTRCGNRLSLTPGAETRDDEPSEAALNGDPFPFTAPQPLPSRPTDRLAGDGMIAQFQGEKTGGGSAGGPLGFAGAGIRGSSASSTPHGLAVTSTSSGNGTSSAGRSGPNGPDTGGQPGNPEEDPDPGDDPPPGGKPGDDPNPPDDPGPPIIFTSLDQPIAVPEPGTWLLLGSGLAALVGWRAREKSGRK